jgi:hypothetical protein
MSEVKCPICPRERNRSSFFYWKYDAIYCAVMIDVATYRRLGPPWTESWGQHFESDPFQRFSSTECSICYDQLTATDSATLIPCQHRYHAKCVASYFVGLERGNLTQNVQGCPAKCPECRREVEEVYTTAKFIGRSEWKRLRGPSGLVKIDFSEYDPLQYTYTGESQEYSPWVEMLIDL